MPWPAAGRVYTVLSHISKPAIPWPSCDYTRQMWNRQRQATWDRVPNPESPSSRGPVLQLCLQPSEGGVGAQHPTRGLRPRAWKLTLAVISQQGKWLQGQPQCTFPRRPGANFSPGRHGTHSYSRAGGLSRAGALTARGSGIWGRGATFGGEHCSSDTEESHQHGGGSRETKREENRTGPGSEMSQAPALVAF